MFTRFNRHYVDLLTVMTMKEFTVRYKQAAFGFLWIILNPLLQMLIIGTIFSYFVKIPNYFAFLFSGLLPWQFFSMTLAKVTPCFVNERSLLQKAAFPREIIPISIIFSNALNLIFSIILFVIAIQMLQPQTINVFTLSIGIMWLIIFTIGVSLLTSSLNVRFRDVAFFVQTLILLWFYVTPILYSLSELPPHLQKLLSLNPLTTPIGLIQSSLLNQITPTPEVISTNIIITLVIFSIGILAFMKESPYFVDWL